MTMRLFRILLSRLSCHPVKKGFAAFSYVILVSTHASCEIALAYSETSWYDERYRH